MMLLAASNTGSGYVAAAYGVFLALVLLYVVIMAAKLVRIEGKISDIVLRLDGDQGADSDAAKPAAVAKPLESQPN